MKKFIFTMLIVLFFSSISVAEENTATKNNDTVYNPSLQNIINTWLKYSTDKELNNLTFLDNYIAVNYCEDDPDIFYKEVKKHKIREIIKKQTEDSRLTLPHVYRLVKKVFVDSYDFEKELIILDKESVFNNVQFLNLIEVKDFVMCRNSYISLNKEYIVDLQGEINITAIPYPENKIEGLLQRMSSNSRLSKYFYVVITIDLSGIVDNSENVLTFRGDVKEVSYYLSSDGSSKFGQYDFKKDAAREKSNYLDDLRFK